MRRALLFVSIVAAVAAGLGAWGSGRALAYGSGDNPVAQVEISLNCTNAAICPAIVGGGEGGLWVWAELDDPNNTGGQSGTTDFTFAGCGHVVGGGGPGSAGGGGFHGEGTWAKMSFFDMFGTYGDDPNFIPAAVALTPDGKHLDTTANYYVINLGGSGDEGPSIFAVPAAQGHYNVSGLQIQIDDFDTFAVTVLHAPGVSGQVQVAP